MDLDERKKVKKEEKYIIQLLRSNSEQGMSLLYDQYSGPLYGIIRRIVNDDNLAEDALQETFVKVWNKFDRFDENKSKLFTWIYAIARNTALDFQRKIVKNQSSDIQKAVDNVLLSTTMNENAIDIQENINTLEDKYREVIEALFFKGYSQREWSKESGTPLGTIKSRLRVGMRILKDIYDKGVLLLFMIINGIL